MNHSAHQENHSTPSIEVNPNVNMHPFGDTDPRNHPNASVYAGSPFARDNGRKPDTLTARPRFDEVNGMALPGGVMSDWAYQDSFHKGTRVLKAQHRKDTPFVISRGATIAEDSQDQDFLRNRGVITSEEFIARLTRPVVTHDRWISSPFQRTLDEIRAIKHENHAERLERISDRSPRYFLGIRRFILDKQIAFKGRKVPKMMTEALVSIHSADKIGYGESHEQLLTSPDESVVPEKLQMRHQITHHTRRQSKHVQKLEDTANHIAHADAIVSQADTSSVIRHPNAKPIGNLRRSIRKNKRTSNGGHRHLHHGLAKFHELAYRPGSDLGVSLRKLEVLRSKRNSIETSIEQRRDTASEKRRKKSNGRQEPENTPKKTAEELNSIFLATELGFDTSKPIRIRYKDDAGVWQDSDQVLIVEKGTAPRKKDGAIVTSYRVSYLDESGVLREKHVSEEQLRKWNEAS